jgi:Lon protease-like protein
MAIGDPAPPPPTTIPIFPLVGVLLLPGGQLPLNIFEPRYLEMVRHAMAGPRLIGMVQPSDPATQSFEPPVYKVGCLGRISAFKETNDGRFLITLSGERRFTIVEELSRTTLYRQVRVAYDGFPLDQPSGREDDSTADRPGYIAELKRYLDRIGLKADWSAIEQAPSGPLVATLAMVLPFEPSEKQALLEARSLAERMRLMRTLMQMSVQQGGEAGSNPPRTLN